MADDFTPTTEDVRNEYTAGRYNDGVGPHWDITSLEFERWLKAHDAEVATAAVLEFSEAVGTYLNSLTGMPIVMNPGPWLQEATRQLDIERSEEPNHGRA